LAGFLPCGIISYRAQHAKRRIWACLSFSVVAVILFAAGSIFRNRIIDWTSKLIKSKEKIGDPENKRSRE
jgi:hypothetical protein